MRIEEEMDLIRRFFPRACRIRAKRHHRSFYRFQVLREFKQWSVAINVHVYDDRGFQMVSCTLRLRKTQFVDPTNPGTPMSEYAEQCRQLQSALRFMAKAMGQPITKFRHKPGE